MRKSMYSGPAEGLYNPYHFRRFMEQRKGTEVVLMFDSMVSYSSDKKLFAVYHISPQQVTAGYSFNDVRPVEKRARAVLAGSRKAIGEVERIIHQAEKKYQVSKRA